MTRRLVLTRRAEADLREIWSYSFRQWDEAQADLYLDQLDDGLQKCRSEPGKGKQREALRVGYWSRLIRKHVAFYTFDDNEVTIHRVLHGSMEPDEHLEH